jgi:hypothetical protein
MFINVDEIEKAKLDPKKVLSIARRLSTAAMESRNLGITVFGGSGNGTLRFDPRDGGGSLVIANLEGNFDGGDGQEVQDDLGLWRGEA